MKLSKLSLSLAAATLTAQAWAAPTEVIEVIGVREQSLAYEQEQVGVELVVVGREIIEQAGTSDLNAILMQNVPGLNVMAKNGRYDYATYSLQGSRSKDLLWLVDGVRINNRLFGAGYLDTISTAMIERIEVLKAGQSVMYGTSALAGVINIVTRSYKGSDGGQISAGFDTMGSTQFNGYVSTKVDDTELTVFGASDSSDGYKPYDDEDYHWTATDRKRGYDVANLGFKVAQTFGDSRLQLMAQYNQADLDYSRPVHNVQTQNKRDQWLAILQGEHRINDSHQLELKGYYHKWDTDYFRLYQMDDGSLDLKNNNDPWWFEDYGLKLAMHSSFAGGHELHYGVEQQRYYGEDQVMGFKSNTERATDLFMQLRPHITALPNTELAVGGRYTSIHDGESGSALEFSARHSLSERWAINLSGGTSFSLPSAYQLFAPEDGDHEAVGNRDLEPEEGKSVNLGVDFGGDALTLNLNLFWREISNLIGMAEVKPDYWQYINLSDEVQTKGIDLNWQAMLGEHWRWDMGVTYSDIEDQEGEDALLNVPDWAAHTRLEYQPSSSRWLSWVSANYVGSMTAYDQEYGEYALVDLGASYSFGEDLAQRLTLKVENLFDEDAQTGVFNTNHKDYDAPIPVRGTPRNLQISYQFDF